MPREVVVPVQSLDRYRPFVSDERFEKAQKAAREFCERMKGHALWNINSTAAGGGVAEMLRSMVGYIRGAGVDSRWSVIDGPRDFFEFTRRLHDALHGRDEWECSSNEGRLYEEVLKRNAVELSVGIRAGDVVLLHDPQTAGLIPHLNRLGAHVVWRCHIGHDAPTESVKKAWEFLEPWLCKASALVFTRKEYVPSRFGKERIELIPPSIDPVSPKNQELSEETVRAILMHTGIILGNSTRDEHRWFTRLDGAPGRVDRYADVIRLGPAPHWDQPVIAQISRWDHLKDPIGVIRGFVRCHAVAHLRKAELVLAGPNVHGVADDPAAAAAFQDVLDFWRALPHADRRRVHLVTLPMGDVDENAAIVNALQRHAEVVVQKSLQEGFGLTVTEAMWKGRPVVASAVGGIQEQIQDGDDGLLVHDPADLRSFSQQLERVMSEPDLARKIGKNAREKVRKDYLGLESMMKYATLLTRLLD
jgi:trehalose synthase